MSRPQDIFGASPKSVLTRPMMHIRDQKATGTAGGTSVTGSNIRVINTEVSNDIIGASLGGNQFTLPAGIFKIDAFVPGHSSGTFKANLEDLSSNVVVQGTNNGLGPYQSPSNHWVRGVFTLTSTTTLQINHHFGVGRASDGLGAAGNVAPYEIYTDIMIEQLDSVVAKPPVIQNSSMYPLPGATRVTGNIIGLSHAKQAANTVRVQPGLAYDSLNTTLLSLSVAYDVTIPSVANTVYRLFLGDNDTVEVDTDANGINTTFTNQRAIGFVRTNGSGEIADYHFIGDWMVFTKASEGIAQAATTSYVSVDWSSLVAVEMATIVLPGATGTSPSGGSVLWFSVDGVNTAFTIGGQYTTSGDTQQDSWHYNGTTPKGVLPVSYTYAKYTNFSGSILCNAVKIVI